MADDINKANGNGEGQNNAGGEGQTNPNGQTENNQNSESDKKYSDADLDKIIQQKFAKWQEKQDKAVADAKAEAEKLAKMNADQKAQYEAEQKDKQIAEMQSQLQAIAMGKVATEMLHEKSIDATQSMLDFIVADTAEETKANVEKFVEIVEAQVKANEIKRATGTTPKSYTGGEPMTEIQKRIAKYNK
jgi:membrane protein involved in colicin uptake